MKKIVYSLLTVFFIASCAEAPKGDAAATTNAQTATAGTGETYIVAPESTIEYYGATPSHGHKGSFNVSEGSLMVDKGSLTGGRFTIDLTKTNILDADTNNAYKLVQHLMSDHFFDIAKYPTATFEITGVEAVTGNDKVSHNVSGNLTLKDSTKNVVIPAMISMQDGSLTATAAFTIDRTDWGMTYGNDKSLKDKFIYPKVEMNLNLKATK